MYTCGCPSSNGVGLAAAVTVVINGAAAITLLPALLARSASGYSAASSGASWAATVRRTMPIPPRPRRSAGPSPGAAPALAGAGGGGVMAVLAIPALSLRMGSSDQGNNPTGHHDRQAYDLLADGFRAPASTAR